MQLQKRGLLIFLLITLLSSSSFALSETNVSKRNIIPNLVTPGPLIAAKVATVSQLWQGIRAGDSITLTISNVHVPVTRVIITFQNTTDFAQLSVAKIEKPADATELTATVYAYLRITPGDFTNEDITGVQLFFSVPREWITAQAVAAEDIRLYHFKNKTWEEGVTKKIADGTLIDYSADVSSFSYFAIGAKKQPQIVSPTLIENKTKENVSEENVEEQALLEEWEEKGEDEEEYAEEENAEEAFSEDANMTSEDATGEDSSEPFENTNSSEPEGNKTTTGETKPKKTGRSWVYILGLAVLICVGLFFLWKRRKSTQPPQNSQ